MAALQADKSAIRHHDGRVQDHLVGAWDWDVLNDRLYADARFAKLFGITADDAASGPPQRKWADAIHPDDQPLVAAAIDTAMQGGLFSAEYRVTPNGETRWLYGRGKCTFKDGRVVRFAGAIVDITDEKLDDINHSIAPH
jgi:PAS domain S-box-containing protein